MDLKEFTSPLPKPWLNINANSVNTGGGPVSTTAYSMLGSTLIANTAVRSSLSSNTAATGSLTIGPLPVGAIVRLSASGTFLYADPPGGGYNFYLLVNGAQIIAIPNNPGTVNATQLAFEGTIVVRPGGMAVATLFISAPGVTELRSVSSVPFALPAGQANTFDMALAFGIAAPSASYNCYYYFAEVLNG